MQLRQSPLLAVVHTHIDTDTLPIASGIREDKHVGGHRWVHINVPVHRCQCIVWCRMPGFGGHGQASTSDYHPYDGTAQGCHTPA